MNLNCRRKGIVAGCLYPPTSSCKVKDKLMSKSMLNCPFADVNYLNFNMKAIWNGNVIAESEQTIIVEGNHYFPPTSISQDFFKESDTKTRCVWKGEASYYHLDVDGKQNPDAAWYYKSLMEAADHIKGYVAFWRGVEVR